MSALTSGCLAGQSAQLVPTAAPYGVTNSLRVNPTLKHNNQGHILRTPDQFTLLPFIPNPRVTTQLQTFLRVTQPLCWLGRTQTPVRRLIWLWHAASWAKS